MVSPVLTACYNPGPGENFSLVNCGMDLDSRWESAERGGRLGLAGYDTHLFSEFSDLGPQRLCLLDLAGPHRWSRSPVRREPRWAGTARAWGPRLALSESITWVVALPCQIVLAHSSPADAFVYEVPAAASSGPACSRCEIPSRENPNAFGSADSRWKDHIADTLERRATTRRTRI